MSDRITVTGMVLSAMPVGEYNVRLVILTTDRGKINGFARGAKRPGNAMMAAASPFVFGDFLVSEGKNAYNIYSAKVSNYFEEIRGDMDAFCYGSYFLEFADYYGRENADDKEMLKLLYQSVRALCKKTIPFPLIRVIYELKIMTINGEFPQCFECTFCHSQKDLIAFSAAKRGVLCRNCEREGGINRIALSPAALYTLQYIIGSPVEKLYTFTVTDSVLSELRRVMLRYRGMYVDRNFKSLEILSVMDLSV